MKRALIIPAFAAICMWPMSLLGQNANAPESKKKSLLEVVIKLEDAGYGPITEIDYDDGDIEAEAYKGDIAYEMLIDGETGEVLAEHRDHGGARPPANARKLSEIIQCLEAEGYTRIRDISFEWKNWEIEAIRERSKRELKVDPVSGKVVSDRVDD